MKGASAGDRLRRFIARCGGALLAATFSQPADAREVGPGLTIDATYIADLLGAVSGGQKTGMGWLGRGDIVAQFDGGAIGADDTIAMIDVLYTHGGDFSGQYTGDAQGISNIQGDGRAKLFEAWVSHPLLADRLRAKVGLIDLNTEFDVQNAGAFFLNGSHGMGPEFSQSGRNGPSTFPFTSVGAILDATGKDWTVRVGVFDPIAGSILDPSRTVFRLPGHHGALLVTEGDVRLGPIGTVSAGIWRYTSRFDALVDTAPDGTPSPQRTSRGAYAAIETRLLERDKASLDGWLRVGWADARVNRIGSSLTGGLVYTVGRHTVGGAVAHARLGDPAMEVARASGDKVQRAETALELSYGWRMDKRLSLQPELQYVINPAWRSDRRNALVIGLRMQALLF
jgi:porin